MNLWTSRCTTSPSTSTDFIPVVTLSSHLHAKCVLCCTERYLDWLLCDKISPVWWRIAEGNPILLFSSAVWVQNGFLWGGRKRSWQEREEQQWLFLGKRAFAGLTPSWVTPFSSHIQDHTAFWSGACDHKLACRRGCLSLLCKNYLSWCRVCSFSSLWVVARTGCTRHKAGDV